MLPRKLDGSFTAGRVLCSPSFHEIECRISCSILYPGCPEVGRALMALPTIKADITNITRHPLRVDEISHFGTHISRIHDHEQLG